MRAIIGQPDIRCDVLKCHPKVGGGQRRVRGLNAPVDRPKCRRAVHRQIEPCLTLQAPRRNERGGQPQWRVPVHVKVQIAIAAHKPRDRGTGARWSGGVRIDPPASAFLLCGTGYIQRSGQFWHHGPQIGDRDIIIQRGRIPRDNPLHRRPGGIGARRVCIYGDAGGRLPHRSFCRQRAGHARHQRLHIWHRHVKRQRHIGASGQAFHHRARAIWACRVGIDEEPLFRLTHGPCRRKWPVHLWHHRLKIRDRCVERDIDHRC